MVQSQLKAAAAVDTQADVRKAAYADALATLKAARASNDKAMTEGDAAKADVATVERRAAWAGVEYVASLPEADRSEVAGAIGEQVAEARGLPKAVRVYRQRFTLACGPYLLAVLETDAEKRDKAFPHSIAAKLKKTADKAAGEEIRAEAEQARRKANGNEAAVMAAASLGLDLTQFYASYFAGEKPTHDAFNRALDLIDRRGELLKSYATPEARAELRAWLASFDD